MFAVFSPSHSTTVQLRGEENSIVHLSQKSDSVPKNAFSTHLKGPICIGPFYVLFFAACKFSDNVVKKLLYEINHIGKSCKNYHHKL